MDNKIKFHTFPELTSNGPKDGQDSASIMIVSLLGIYTLYFRLGHAPAANLPKGLNKLRFH